MFLQQEMWLTKNIGKPLLLQERDVQQHWKHNTAYKNKNSRQ
jgi:hypothetical protein